jgi:uncharacterized membrane protein YccC
MPTITEKTQNDVVNALAMGSASMQAATLIIKVAEQKLDEQAKRISELEALNRAFCKDLNELRSKLGNVAAWHRAEAQRLDEKSMPMDEKSMPILAENHRLAAAEIDKLLVWP